MRILEVASDVDLDGPTAANGAALDLADGTYDAPFLPGYTVVAQINADSWSEAEANAVALSLQGSDDNSSWSTLLTLDADSYPSVMAEVQLPRYIRHRMHSATAGDGRGSINLLGN